MKAVVLAGGKGTRLYPLTKTINKHILPVWTSPLLWYPLWSLKNAGFKEVLIVTDRKDSGDIIGICGSGKDLGMDITYRIQDQAGGVAEALGLAESYVGEEEFICILADNVFTYDLNLYIDKYLMLGKDKPHCSILTCPVDDPLRYALIERTDGKITKILEKPTMVISDEALTGIAIFDWWALKTIHGLKPSARNELEYTDVLNSYIEHGWLDAQILDKNTWADAGTFSGIDRASKIVADAHFLPFPEIDRKDL